MLVCSVHIIRRLDFHSKSRMLAAMLVSHGATPERWPSQCVQNNSTM